MPARIQRKRTRDWTLAGATDNPLGAVIVSRPSRYGNPFRVADCIEAGFAETESEGRRYVTDLFADWLDGTGPEVYRVNGRPYDRRRILAALADGTLAGRDLACTCPLPEPGQPDHCHGVVLLRRANGGAL